MPCQGNPDEICGSGNSMNVYCLGSGCTFPPITSTSVLATPTAHHSIIYTRIIVTLTNSPPPFPPTPPTTMITSSRVSVSFLSSGLTPTLTLTQTIVPTPSTSAANTYEQTSWYFDACFAPNLDTEYIVGIAEYFSLSPCLQFCITQTNITKEPLMPLIYAGLYNE